MPGKKAPNPGQEPPNYQKYANGGSRGGGGRSPPRSPPRRGAPSAGVVPVYTPMQPTPQRRPSIFRDAAAIAGGVTAGTAVGHVAGAAITSLFSGPRREEVVHALPRDYTPGREPEGPCAFEISQFLQCASANQGDLSICEEVNSLLQECKRRNRIP